MLQRRPLALALLLVARALGQGGKDLGSGWQEKQKDGRVVQELKLEAPAMTEEDQYGYVMPDKYRCDSCKAVMFHLDAALRNRHPKSRKMKAWEYTDLMDETCRSGFKGYGIKLVDGKNALSGPGIKNDPLSPGMGAIQMGGENWEKRLGEICRKIVYEKIGEDDIYEMFYTQYRAERDGAANPVKGLSESLCMSSEIQDCVTGPELPPASEAKDVNKKSKVDKKSKSKPKVDKKKEKATASKKGATPSKEPSTQGKAERHAPSTGGKPERQAATTDSPVNAETFLRSLAVKHGLTPEEYLTARPVREWEKLTVAMAGRIFNRAAEDNDGTCLAN